MFDVGDFFKQVKLSRWVLHDISAYAWNIAMFQAYAGISQLYLDDRSHCSDTLSKPIGNHVGDPPT